MTKRPREEEKRDPGNEVDIYKLVVLISRSANEYNGREGLIVRIILNVWLKVCFMISVLSIFRTQT